ncbi:MAG: hypothetical protein A2V70_00180 [Planctomycetes bacterium RBG_13_63_9]|nr:MAG: hypothetical protein A2V70_00180 [Planctomycetes bacterium RBG_13_63_9]
MIHALVEAASSPLFALLLGLVTVVGMIIVLRVNAFLALISAAMLVSLLAPGPPGEKMARVATEFGNAAGKIGIVIAMAAVIGKCLMDSGAADRIVRSILRLLGEKRASAALLGSGFVLSIPVFFDTVFYLLVPLARSLWRRTHKNYMLYILSIGAGAAITHTLVPPTPGPLVMAENLNVNVGLMILVGTLIALPTAAVGLLVCRVMNRLMNVPCRPYSGQPEPEPLADDQLPALWVALLPVVLPVILISTNTVMQTIADEKHAALVHEGDVADWPGLCSALDAAGDQQPNGSAARVVELLPPETRQRVVQALQSGTYSAEFRQQTRDALNHLLADRKFYQEEAFVGTKLSEPAERLLDLNLDRLPEADVEQLNRLLLESTFPDQIKPHLQRPWRRVADVTALLGNVNLALLLSAAIAMGTLVRQRGLSLIQLAKTTEEALMSGGVIILITAAGGAFGAMLRAANVKDAVEGLVGSSAENTGLVMLSIGFAVAAVMKIAQGSGTVSMITTSAMVAAMGVSPEMLGFHPVYLAAAIGSGSLVGSWMNDSGFWIVARMSGLTEVETLKSWTTLLVILGFIALGFTMLAAWALPLTST